MLKIQNLSKKYKSGNQEYFAIKNIDLNIKQGEIFGFLGINGAGKTTTLKIIMGLTSPTSGTVSINGYNPHEKEMRMHTGFLPENPHFYKYLTGREFLRFCANLFGLEKNIREERITHLLNQVSLRDVENIHLKNYSKGMLQRVGIAQALINNPDIVFLDEPMSGLDPIGRKEIKDILFSLKKEGKTVFFSSHILQDVESLCDRIAILHRGEIVDCGTLAKLTKGKDLESYFIQKVSN